MEKKDYLCARNAEEDGSKTSTEDWFVKNAKQLYRYGSQLSIISPENNQFHNSTG